jgi:hypothetical protein
VRPPSSPAPHPPAAPQAGACCAHPQLRLQLLQPRLLLGAPLTQAPELAVFSGAAGAARVVDWLPPAAGRAGGGGGRAAARSGGAPREGRGAGQSRSGARLTMGAAGER